MKKIFLFAILFSMTMGAVNAQVPMTSSSQGLTSYYTFSWNTAFPMGDFKTWVDKPDPAGFDFGGMYPISDNFMAGFNLGWQRVAQIYENETFSDPDQGLAITATNYKMTWLVPVQALVAYHPMPDGLISPYFGLGIGTDYAEHHLLVQEIDLNDTRWDFSLAPELGMNAKFGRDAQWGGFLAFNYKWTTNRIEFY